MFVRIGICGEVAGDEFVAGSDSPEPVRSRKLGVLRRDIAATGIAVFQSNTERNRFINTLSDVEAQRWTEEILAAQRSRLVRASGTRCACEESSLISLREGWKADADAVICPTLRAVADYGLRPETHPITDDGSHPEVAGLGAVDALSVVAKAREVANKKILGMQRETVWRDRLLPVAAGSREFTLLDSYVAQAAARRIADGGVDRSTRPLTGLSWLLWKTAAVAERPLKVRIYTRLRPGSEFTIEELSGAIRQLLHVDLLSRISSVQVWDWAPRPTGPDPNSRMHQRVLQLDACAVRMGYGAGLFDEETVKIDEVCAPYGAETGGLYRDIESAATSRLEWRRRAPESWERLVRLPNGQLGRRELLRVLDARGQAV